MGLLMRRTRNLGCSAATRAARAALPILGAAQRMAVTGMSPSTPERTRSTPASWHMAVVHFVATQERRGGSITEEGRGCNAKAGARGKASHSRFDEGNRPQGGNGGMADQILWLGGLGKRRDDAVSVTVEVSQRDAGITGAAMHMICLRSLRGMSPPGDNIFATSTTFHNVVLAIPTPTYRVVARNLVKACSGREAIWIVKNPSCGNVDLTCL